VLGLVAAGSLTWLFPIGSGDRVARAETEQRERDFVRVQPMVATPVSPSEVPAAINRLPLKDAERSAMLGALHSDTTVPAPASRPAAPLRLIQLTVWDTHRQDGDVAAFSTGGFRIDVPLTKAPQLITIPVDASNAVRVSGVRDGGGGITLGIRGSAGAVLMPIMSEGQELILPLR
jgi:hypothetical protein